MKLLFDQNLSYKLVDRLADIFSGSEHVQMCNLNEMDDFQIWAYAKENGFTIVTQDSDFYDIGLIRGIPPKVIWIRAGNASTAHVEKLLRDNVNAFNEFERDKVRVCYEIF